MVWHGLEPDTRLPAMMPFRLLLVGAAMLMIAAGGGAWWWLSGPGADDILPTPPEPPRLVEAGPTKKRFLVGGPSLVVNEY